MCTQQVELILNDLEMPMDPEETGLSEDQLEILLTFAQAQE